MPSMILGFNSKLFLKLKQAANSEYFLSYALHLAVNYPSYESAKTLLSLGASIEVRDYNGG